MRFIKLSLSSIMTSDLLNRLYCINKMIIDGVSELLGQILWVSSPHQKQGEKSVSICVRKHLVFDVQPPRSPELSPLDFYLWGNLKARAYSAPFENEDTLDQSIFYACQIIRSRSGNFERARGSVIRRVPAGINSYGGYLQHLLSIVTW